VKFFEIFYSKHTIYVEAYFIGVKMKSLIISLTLLFSQSPKPEILLPDTVPAQAGVFVPITAVTAGETVKFVALDPGLSVFPSNLLSDKKTTVVVAIKEGRYRVLAYTSINNQPSNPAYTTVVVGDVGPIPPPVPPPGPGPMPPTPPNPKPPEPDDGFLQSLKSVYGGLQEPDKAESVKRLKQVYVFAAAEADNSKYTNLGQLYTSVRSMAVQALKADKIVPIRDMIADELDAKLGTDPSLPMTPDNRKKCKDAFNRINTLLGGLNG
jgi:hypothetical protein